MALLPNLKNGLNEPVLVFILCSLFILLFSPAIIARHYLYSLFFKKKEINY